MNALKLVIDISLQELWHNITIHGPSIDPLCVASIPLYSLISLEVIMLDLLQCSGLYLGCLFVLTKQLNENVKIIRQRGSLFYNSLCDKNSLPNPVN